VNVFIEDIVMSKSPILLISYAVVSVFSLTLAADVRANEQQMSACRAITAAAARLACYDAIPVIGSVALPAATSKVTPQQEQPKAASSATSSSADFGLPATVPAANIDKINSSIAGRFVGWQANSRITLANGQVWQVIDDSRGVCECDNPKVVVTRGTFGTFFLEIAGKGSAPRVKRIQ
jgi:hypothetical protein